MGKHFCASCLIRWSLYSVSPRVTDLRPNDTEEAPFFYTFKVQCTSCREIHPNFVTVNRFEMNEQSGSKGEANFVWKCKNCKVVLTQSFFS
jgi:hypothetical protein